MIIVIDVIKQCNCKEKLCDDCLKILKKFNYTVLTNKLDIQTPLVAK